MFPLQAYTFHHQAMVMNQCPISSDNALEKFMTTNGILLQEWESDRGTQRAHTLWNPNPWMILTTILYDRLKLLQFTNHNTSIFENWIFHVSSCLVGLQLYVCCFSHNHQVPKCTYHPDSSHHSCKLQSADEFLLQRYSLHLKTALLPWLHAWTTVPVKSSHLTDSSHHTWCKVMRWPLIWCCQLRITNHFATNPIRQIGTDIMCHVNLFLDCPSYKTPPNYITGFLEFYKQLKNCPTAFPFFLRISSYTIYNKYECVQKFTYQYT